MAPELTAVGSHRTALVPAWAAGALGSVGAARIGSAWRPPHSQVGAAAAGLRCTHGASLAVAAAPPTQDCPARPKRKRTCGSYDPCSEAASAGQPQGGAPLTAGAASPAPALEPSPAGVPWAASFLFDYVHQCLDNLSSMHAACLAIQRDTRAAAMACAIFRQAPTQPCTTRL